MSLTDIKEMEPRADRWADSLDLPRGADCEERGEKACWKEETPAVTNTYRQCKPIGQVRGQACRQEGETVWTKV